MVHRPPFVQVKFVNISVLTANFNGSERGEWGVCCVCPVCVKHCHQVNVHHACNVVKPLGRSLVSVRLAAFMNVKFSKLDL